MKADRQVMIAPSILSADFGRLGEQVAEAEAAGADCIHVDIMDGQFVPPITFGPMVVEAIRGWLSIPVEIHMMTYQPERHIAQLADAGADGAVDSVGSGSVPKGVCTFVSCNRSPHHLR